MKRYLMVFCSLLAFTPQAIAQSQGDRSTGTAMPMAAMPTFAPGGPMPMMPYYGGYPATGGQQIDVIDDDKAQEPKKKYRYEGKKGPISKADLPQRNFNNITYPY